MKLLKTITEQSLGLDETPQTSVPIKERIAARAIVFNEKQQIALLFAQKDLYHKLPGGGVENGEDYKLAVMREVMEEIGCSITLRPVDLGSIEESRLQFGLHQISFCYIADVNGSIGVPTLTDDEKNALISDPRWMTLSEAIETLKNDTPTSYVGRFIQARDLTFLQAAQVMLTENVSIY